MLVLALDLSSCAGYAVLEGETGRKPRIVERGTFELSKPAKDYGSYPWNYIAASDAIAEQVERAALAHSTGEALVFVVEETNLGKQRYSQKLLEWIHLRVLERLRSFGTAGEEPPVHYVSSRSWRKTLGLALSKEQRALNQQVSRAKQKSKGTDGKVDIKRFNAEKKKLGVKGRINWKTLSVDFVNDTERGYGLQLKKGDNDIADAICVGTVFFFGAEVCDGTTEQ